MKHPFRWAALAAFFIALTLVSGTSAASKVQPPKFINPIYSVTGEHPTSGLSGFPARDYLTHGQALVRSPFSGCVPRNRPWGRLAYQAPNSGFGGSRIYLLQTKTGRTAYLAHFGINNPYGDLYLKPGDCFKQGDPVGTVWLWPHNPGRSHIHMGWQGGDPLVRLVDRNGNFLVQEGPVWTPKERVFPRPLLRHEGQWWRVRVGKKLVYQGGEEKASQVYNRQKLARAINLHFRQTFEGSPLVGFGLVMVRTARARDVDPRLEAAISSCETGAGTKGNGPKVNNDFGLLVNGQHREFKNRKAAIVYVSNLLRTKYKGLDTIPKIGAKYAPAGASNDPHGKNSRWVSCVTQFYKALHGTRYL